MMVQSAEASASTTVSRSSCPKDWKEAVKVWMACVIGDIVAEGTGREMKDGGGDEAARCG